MPISELIDTIIQGDCLEVLKTFPDKSMDLILTDPPYGIGRDKGTSGFGLRERRQYSDNWDNAKLSGEYFKEILRVGKKIIIFGGNYFIDFLPVSGHWIVWDKVGMIKFQNPFSDCELAWTNLSLKIVKKYTIVQQGFISQEKKDFILHKNPLSYLWTLYGIIQIKMILF
jgi:DNA modification methylase